MNSPEIPVEILELIITNLATTDKDWKEQDVADIFRVCCLVCQDFLPLFRAHLFREIEIRFYDDLSITRSRLIQLLEKNPSISSYVKKVTYTFNSEREQDLIKQYGGHVDDCWVIHKGNYPMSLHTFFPNATTLRIEHAYSDREKLAHSGVTCPEYKCATFYLRVLQDYTIGHSITSLIMRQLHVSINDAFPLPVLKKINVLFCQWPSPNYHYHLTAPMQPPVSLHHPPLELEDLYVDYSQHFPVNILKYCHKLVRLETTHDTNPLNTVNFISTHNIVASYQHLRIIIVDSISTFADIFLAGRSSSPTGDWVFPALLSLRVNFRTPIHDEGAKLRKLIAHSPKLRSLELIHIYTSYNAASPALQLDLGIATCSPTLEHLRLENNSWYDNVDSDVIQLLCTALSHIKGRNYLKTVELKIFLRPNGINKWMRVTLGPWEQLDHLLAKDVARNFPSLETLDFIVDYTCFEYDIGEEWMREQEEMFRDFWTRSLTVLQATVDTTRIFENCSSRLVFTFPRSG